MQYSKRDIYRCDSWNCLSTGVCGVTAATPRHFGAYVYVLVALGIIGGKCCRDHLLGRCANVFCSRHVWNPYRTVFCPSETARPRTFQTSTVLEGTGKYCYWIGRGPILILVPRMLSTKISCKCERLRVHLSLLYHKIMVGTTVEMHPTNHSHQYFRALGPRDQACEITLQMMQVTTA